VHSCDPHCPAIRCSRHAQVVNLNAVPRLLANRFEGWPRRVLIVVFLGLAVLSAVNSRRPTGRATTSEVVVLARDVVAGTQLGPADVRARAFPRDLLARGSLRNPTDVVGHRVAATMSSGTPLTSLSLIDGAVSAAIGPGQVAVAVTLATGSVPGLLTPGVTIDLYPLGANPANSAAGAPTGRSPPTAPLASRLRVLAALPQSPEAGKGAALVLACDRTTAGAIAAISDGVFAATLVPAE
jgi:Flp pilus assembly protein CpaB